MALKIKDYVKVLPRLIDRLSIGRRVETTYDFLADVKSQLEEYIELRPNVALPKSLDKFGKSVRGLNRIGKPKKNEPLYTLLEALKITVDNKAKISDYIKREITSDVATTAISYKKANILAYISTLNNAGKYIHNLLWLLIATETEKTDKAVIEAMTKSVYETTVKELNDYGASFITVLGKDSEEVLNAFNTTPDVVVSDDDAGDALVNNATADPMKLGFLPANNINPFFLIGKVVIHIEDLIYRNRLDMKQLIELRLADLRSRDDAAESPALQAEIESLENKLASLNYKLEKSMGGNV